MITEALMTAFLRRKYRTLLQLTDFEDLAPPPPRPDGQYLIYVHIPFCEELCPYCSFNRFPLEKDLAREYFSALRTEIRMYADRGYDFNSAYIGGGTPTVLPDEAGSLLEELRRLFPIKEISMETNPNHLTDPILRILKEGGVNRLSVGVQSFDNGLLEKMERKHKYGAGEEIKDRLTTYTGMFDTLNVDMIFNFPGQTDAMVERDVGIIREINANQATFYPLMTSDATGSELARRFGSISYRQEKRFYNLILDRLGRDYAPGTAWCFSRNRGMIDEYIIDHDEYVGAGSGSFGYLDGAVWANTFSVPMYVESITNGRFPLFAKKDFSLLDRARYDFLMKLFGTRLDLEAVEKKFDGKFQSSLRKELFLFKLCGAVKREAGELRLTRKGLYYWVIMMREFFIGVNNFRDICRAKLE